MSWPWRRTQSHLIQGSAAATRRVTARRLPVAFGRMLRLERVTKRFGDVVAVDELSLDVADGEVCVLIGPSGCGKTTTLKMVNRLIEPTSGRILLAGEDISAADPVELRRRIGYVIQQVGLF